MSTSRLPGDPHKTGETHKVLALLEGGFAQLRVLVVGDLMLDRYIHGEVERISPEAPVPVLRDAQRYDRAGGAANVAMNLAGLGCTALLAGFWGEDAERRDLVALLNAAAIDSTGVVTTAQPTTSKTRILGRHQQLLRLDIEARTPPAERDLQRLQEVAVDLVSKVHAVILSDYAKGALPPELCFAVIAEARRQEKMVLVDPKSAEFQRYSGATVLCPNLGELAAATGVAAAELDRLLAAGEAQRQEHELTHLCVTMSEHGITLLSEGGRFHVPARAREVFDVSGAGDTVIATLAAALAGGLEPQSAVELANLAASIVVGKSGTAAIRAHELIGALTPASGVAAAEKVLDRERLLLRLAEWRAAHETIVFTNGCFDLLHIGHITLLEECRRFGTRVVLGLNSDASVQRLKGPSRPVVRAEDRARVMAALAAVDAVIVFEEDTPLALIEAIRPEVLVKGGDYSVETVVGHELVLAAGGRVEIVPTVEGFSTTGLLTKMHS